jgi:hypothetical protein
MSAADSSAEPPKKVRNRHFIAIVVVIVLGLSGFLVYAYTQTFQTGTECTVSAEGTGFYLTVLTSSGSPVVGAQVSGSRITEIGTGTCAQNIGTWYTNSNGTVSISDNIGSYYMLTVGYQGRNYPIRAPISPMQTTYVKLIVPSGNYTTSFVFEGGCTTTNGGVTCPG